MRNVPGRRNAHWPNAERRLCVSAATSVLPRGPGAGACAGRYTAFAAKSHLARPDIEFTSTVAHIYFNGKRYIAIITPRPASGTLAFPGTDPATARRSGR
jgi:hypothetical protein